LPAGEALLVELLSQRSGGGAPGIPAEARDQIAAGLKQEAQEALQMLAADLAEIDAAIKSAAGNAAPAAVGLGAQPASRATADRGSQRSSAEQQQDDVSVKVGSRSSSSGAEDAQLLAELLQQRRQLQKQQQLLQQLLAVDVPSSNSSSSSRPAAGRNARSGFQPSATPRQQQSGTRSSSSSSSSSDVGLRVVYGVPEAFQCQPLQVCVAAGDAAVMLWALGMARMQVRPARQLYNPVTLAVLFVKRLEHSQSRSALQRVIVCPVASVC
jgi:hypothetical protein